MSADSHTPCLLWQSQDCHLCQLTVSGLYSVSTDSHKLVICVSWQSQNCVPVPADRHKHVPYVDRHAVTMLCQIMFIRCMAPCVSWQPQDSCTCCMRHKTLSMLADSNKTVLGQLEATILYPVLAGSLETVVCVSRRLQCSTRYQLTVTRLYLCQLTVARLHPA